MPPKPPLTRTYALPAVKVGDHIRCLFRKHRCVVTGWTTGPLSWPTGSPLRGSGGTGILVTVALVRAVRTESFEAISDALGVSRGTVFNWRRQFG